MSDYEDNFLYSQRTKRRKVRALVEAELSNLVAISTTDSDVDLPNAYSSHKSELISTSEHVGLAGDVQHHTTLEKNEELCVTSDEVNDEAWETGGFDSETYNSHSDSEESSGDDEQSSESLNLKLRLAQWAVEFNIPHSALSKLLNILQDAKVDVPKDPRTLLSTPNANNIQSIAGGSYHYFGVANMLRNELLQLKSIPSKMLTLNVNIDGLPLFRSSRVNVWPILCMVSELAGSKPFIVGIFSGSSKPTSVDEYLNNFVEEMKVLMSNGLTLNGTHYDIKIGAFICDAPARAFVKCIKGHNGYQSCERCVQEGEHVDGRMIFPAVDASERTDDQFLGQVSEDHHVGTSPLTQLGVGCVTQFPLDYMHLVCLGIVRRMILLWLKGPNLVKCRLSSKTVNDISGQLVILRKYLPREFSRKPRSLTEVMQWKATEFRQFLLYTGPVILSNSLKDRIYRNFMALSVSMMLLLNPSTNEEQCGYTEELLKVFVRNFAIIYGRSALVYNVHSVIHLPQDFRRYGALDGVSAFPFESYLGRLKRQVRRGQNPISQLVNRVGENTNMNIRSEESSNNLEFKFLKPHFKGPVPSNLTTCQQFYGIQKLNTLISCKSGDNCFEILEKIAIVRNTLLSSNNEILIVYEEFIHYEPFFHYPLDSSSLGVYFVSKKSGVNKIARINDIGKKCVMLPYKQGFVVFPLLHSCN